MQLEFRLFPESDYKSISLWDFPVISRPAYPFSTLLVSSANRSHLCFSFSTSDTASFIFIFQGLWPIEVKLGKFLRFHSKYILIIFLLSDTIVQYHSFHSLHIF